MASCKEWQHHAFLAEKLLKNRSVFMSAPWAGDEKGHVAAIKHLWPSAANRENKRSQPGKTPVQVSEAQRKETAFAPVSCKMGLMITTRRAGSADERSCRTQCQAPANSEPSGSRGQCCGGTGLLWCLLPGNLIVHFGGRVGRTGV